MTSKTLFYALIVLWISASLFWTVIPRKRRTLFLTGLSLAFCSLFGIVFFLYYCFTLIVVYRISFLLRNNNKSSPSIVKWSIIWLVAILCVFKYADGLMDLCTNTLGFFVDLPGIKLPALALPVSLSYFTFRMIHYLVEWYRKTLPGNSLQDLVLYALFSPHFYPAPSNASSLSTIRLFISGGLIWRILITACSVLLRVFLENSLLRTIWDPTSCPRFKTRNSIPGAIGCYSRSQSNGI